MKKLICVLLTLMLCISAISGVSADERGDFVPAAVSTLPFTSEQWMASGSNRATYALVMYQDFLTDGGDDLHDVYGSSVGELDGTLYAVLHSDMSSLIITYKVGEATAAWKVVATPSLFDVLQYEIPAVENIIPNADSDIVAVLQTFAN